MRISDLTELVGKQNLEFKQYNSLILGNISICSSGN